MSTTFAVVTPDGTEIDVAFRSNGTIKWTNTLASMLPDNQPVIPTDNTAQGIDTIGDIKNAISPPLKETTIILTTSVTVQTSRDVPQDEIVCAVKKALRVDGTKLNHCLMITEEEQLDGEEVSEHFC